MHVVALDSRMWTHSKLISQEVVTKWINTEPELERRLGNSSRVLSFTQTKGFHHGNRRRGRYAKQRLCYCDSCRKKTIKTFDHTVSHKPRFISFEPRCLYVPIQYIQYIHLAMGDCTEICYSSADIRGTNMYTKKTNPCPFTTVK